MDEPPDDLMTVGEAAKLARCDVRSLTRWILHGKLKGWKRIGQRFVSRAEVAALFARIPTLPPPPKPETARERNRRELQTRRILEAARMI